MSQEASAGGWRVGLGFLTFVFYFSEILREGGERRVKSPQSLNAAAFNLSGCRADVEKKGMISKKFFGVSGICSR